MQSLLTYKKGAKLRYNFQDVRKKPNKTQNQQTVNKFKKIYCIFHPKTGFDPVLGCNFKPRQIHISEIFLTRFHLGNKKEEREGDKLGGKKLNVETTCTFM